MKPGSRVRVVWGPWPERIGCVATVVGAPEGYRSYPWHGLGKREVVVLLDDDPLSATKPRGYGGQAWTCVIDRGDLEETSV